MINHQSPGQIDWDLNRSTQTFDLYARKDAAAGTEVLYDYSQYQRSIEDECGANWDTLALYGFAVPNASCPKLILVLPKFDAHRNGERQDSPKFELTSSWKTDEASQFLGHLRLRCLLSHDMEVPTGKCDMTLEVPVCRRLLTRHVEVLALQLGLQLVTYALGNYSSALDDDNARLPLLRGVERYAALIVIEEKTVLHWWRDFLNGAEQSISEELGLAVDHSKPGVEYARQVLSDLGLV
eukprot:gnl/MRDRNA2_/MRDRNA2_139323_c0_seq1.p1 gnl/MRDRNA2_/MRDRNA2_139323_c0~~gnl/MRDRNA2_/MRDRNA2_139323_c0_seq1.p1  ORF type:complete len:253 (+),score=42.39 gnl/MRDRNA2_/MRDRNA2_139323_c0_seq1:45-761(+)